MVSVYVKEHKHYIRDNLARYRIWIKKSEEEHENYFISNSYTELKNIARAMYGVKLPSLKTMWLHNPLHHYVGFDIEPNKQPIHWRGELSTKYYRDFTSERDRNNGNITDWIYFPNSNSKNEKMILNLSFWENGKKSPFIPFRKYIICRTYVTTQEGCFEKYNPQLDGNKINWEWYLEGTPENEQAIIDEVARRFYEEA